MLEKGYTLSLAESCTGGRIASCLTSIPGASKVLKGGAVTYSNESKVDLLGVSEDTLKAHGAVSSQVAEEMAMGALSRFGADIALASTGIAGPGGGSKEKPVGLVYLAISMGGKSKVKKLNFIGGRERIIRFACLHAFDMIRRLTLGLPWVE
ncbi:MAG: CinA family protein [Oscillospiraceae bacterium]|nr:CinA family protein [Oscillospiraceae bacterium]